MSNHKIVNESEAIDWITSGKTYQWMAETHLAKYNVQVSPAAFSNLRRRHGLPGRQVRDEKLIPWKVNREHRYDWPIQMLRLEARRRAGKPLTENEQKDLQGWLNTMQQDGCVVHYQPDTEQGWFYVEPRPGIDNDLIREPEVVIVKR